MAEAPSDIFSLGCMLYEMIAGRRAFARETAAQWTFEHHYQGLMSAFAEAAARKRAA